VGHNPSFGELAHGLDDGAGAPDARRELRSGFPTSAVAVFELLAGWPDAALGHGTLTAFAAPRG
jgi:phosphohistidine phosphatase SixA